MDFGTFQLLVNLAILAAVFALDKYQIGLGTLINMVGVGYLIELFTWLLGFLPKFRRPGQRRRSFWSSARCCSRWACRCT